MPSKVLLATCALAERWKGTVDHVNGHYPLGIAYLQSTLEEAGHTVETLFLNHVTHDECLAQVLASIERQQPQVLGISIITDTRISSFRIIEHVHQHYPQIQIVLGGVHVSTMYEQIAERFPYTTLALGEAEITLRELVHVFETNGDRAAVPGLAYAENGRVVMTARRELIEDLDTLPFPRHAAFFNEGRAVAQIITSRGCPFACTFCVLDSFSRRKVRYRSPQSVVDEIENILREFPQVRAMHILDDQFFSDNQRVIEICDEIARRKIQCEFYCAGRMKPLSRAMVLALERAGVKQVYLGLESGDREVLKRAKKGITPEDAIRAMELFADSSIVVTVLMIIGLPGESIATIMETAQLLQRLQRIKYHTYNHRIQTLFVYPGSELYTMCKEAGAITDDYWLTEGDAPFYTLEHNAQDLGILREILLTYTSAVRLLTPGGLATQRHLLPEIIRTAFSKVELMPLAKLALHAAEDLLQEGALHFALDQQSAMQLQAQGHLALSSLEREIGADGRFIVHGTATAPEDSVRDIVQHAYLHRCHEITNIIDERVSELLKRYMSSLHHPENLLNKLGFAEWATGSNNIQCRL